MFTSVYHGNHALDHLSTMTVFMLIVAITILLRKIIKQNDTIIVAHKHQCNQRSAASTTTTQMLGKLILKEMTCCVQVHSIVFPIERTKQKF